jgi:hypothetical protein
MPFKKQRKAQIHFSSAERLNQQIDEGLAQLDRGEGIDGEVALQAQWEKSRKRRHPALLDKSNLV